MIVVPGAGVAGDFLLDGVGEDVAFGPEVSAERVDRRAEPAWVGELERPTGTRPRIRPAAPRKTPNASENP